MMSNNPNIGLGNFNMYTKFSLILLIRFQDITKILNSDINTMSILTFPNDLAIDL